jgi:hypothetical protein
VPHYIKNWIAVVQKLGYWIWKTPHPITRWGVLVMDGAWRVGYSAIGDGEYFLLLLQPE